ncbi:MAG: N-acetylmuramoyl-L-alanine amidase [Oscillospiraceae bacterium]|nr:N-acetylmuramoyl-L-alanine amidase [Oscillospiraceae bacterium]
MERIQDFIPKGRINRPGTANSCKYITIHDTGNKSPGADAAAHAKYIKSLNEKTSWHYTVDDECIYQHLPDNEKSYHTSDKEANESSIAVELCVNADGDFEKTVENAIDLIRDLTKKFNIPAENIKRHKDWTGKNCPASFNEAAWKEFLARCTAAESRSERYITIDELKQMGYAGVKW